MSTSLPPPKRNLSAYNLFFQCERKRILQGTSGNGVPLSFEEVSRVTLEYKLRGKRRHKKTHGKVAFRDMARMIAKSWRVLDDDSKMALNAQAAIEKAEYQKQVAAWKAAEMGMDDDHAPNNDTKQQQDQEEQEGGSTRNTLQNNNGQAQNEPRGPRRSHQEDQIQHHGGFGHCFAQEVSPSAGGMTPGAAGVQHHGGAGHRFKNTCSPPHSSSCHHDEQREGETRGFSGPPRGGSCSSEPRMAMMMNEEPRSLLLEHQEEHHDGSFELLCSPSSVSRQRPVTMHPNGGCFKKQNWRTNAIVVPQHHGPPPTAQVAAPPKNKNASCPPTSALRKPVTMDWEEEPLVNEQDEGNDHSMMRSSSSPATTPPNKEFSTSSTSLFIHLLGTNYDLLHQIIAPDELDTLFDDGEDDL